VALWAELNMAKWKRLHDIAKSAVEIDLDTVEFMQRNGNGSELHFNNGRTLTVRESPKDIRKPTAATSLLAPQASRKSLRRS
jgi:hypothetical protein